jgi:hypothetical protein
MKNAFPMVLRAFRIQVDTLAGPELIGGEEAFLISLARASK